MEWRGEALPKNCMPHSSFTRTLLPPGVSFAGLRKKERKGNRWRLQRQPGPSWNAFVSTHLDSFPLWPVLRHRHAHTHFKVCCRRCYSSRLVMDRFCLSFKSLRKPSGFYVHSIYFCPSFLLSRLAVLSLPSSIPHLSC